MVLGVNKTNDKGESGINRNYNVTRDNTNSCQFKSAQTYSESWYVREPSTYGSGSASAPVDRQLFVDSSFWCWSREPIEQAKPRPESTMRYTNGPHSAATMVASYGVYHDANLRSHQDDDDGFIPRANVYRGVVVNATGDSTVVRNSHLQETTAQEQNSCGWCIRNEQPSATPPDRSCLASWCRPTILLLILILLVVVFVLVSGVLLYFNCMSHDHHR